MDARTARSVLVDRAVLGSVLRATLALLVVALLAPAPSAAGPQEGPEDLAEDALDAFDDALDDRRMRDVEEALRDMALVYDKVSERTVKKFHKAYGKLFKFEPRGEVKEDGSDPRAEVLAAYQLAVGTVFDKEGGDKLLLAALKNGHVKKWADARALFVEAIGHRLDPENIDVLADALEDDDAVVVRVAAAGLGLLSEAEVDVRRACVEPLIDALSERVSDAEKEERKGKETEAQEFLLAVEGTLHEALVELTRERFSTAAEYEAWFDEVGRGDRW